MVLYVTSHELRISLELLCRYSSVVTLSKIDTDVSILSVSSSEHLSEQGKLIDRIEFRCRRHTRRVALRKFKIIMPL